MSIGLFLDVDRTLTKDYIQAGFARILGVYDRYDEIEKDYQAKKITSAEFGRRIIDLFNASNFSRKFAEEHHHEIELELWTEEVLSAKASIYLVSNGPDYYILPFAERHNIPSENALCSKYIFNGAGKLIDCKAATDDDKARFVEKNKGRHLITFGVGDNEKSDGPFISRCDVPIITMNYSGSCNVQNSGAQLFSRLTASGFLYVEHLGRVASLVANLSYHLPFPNTDPRIFIASSKESGSIAQALSVALAETTPLCEPAFWPFIFEPSDTNIESLERELAICDFAAFIMTPDDVTRVRGAEKNTVRDNVVFELSLFMGRLGRDRCFLIHPRDQKPDLASDLLGIVTLSYQAGRKDGNILQALNPTVFRIKESIKTHGPRVLSA